MENDRLVFSSVNFKRYLQYLIKSTQNLEWSNIRLMIPRFLENITYYNYTTPLSQPTLKILYLIS